MAVWSALLAIACGPAPQRHRIGGLDAFLEDAQGVKLLVVARPTEGRLWLSMWIDAGARDADPPQLATVAAWTASSSLEARVLADGIELARPCSREVLAECLQSFAEALATREVSAESLTPALERLRTERERALADDGRRADALALDALLGHPSDPFGAARDDERVDREAVRAWREAHFGRGRALLVAVGDLEPSVLREHAEEAFDALPETREVRRERGFEDSTRARVEVGERDVVSVAVPARDVADASAIAHRWLGRARADLTSGAALHAEAFPLRGGAVALMRVDGRDDAARVLLEHVLELRASAPEPMPLAPPEGPQLLARWLGARWSTQGEPSSMAGIGVGAIAAGGRGDAIDDRDPNTVVQSERTQAFEAMLASATAEPSLDGSLRSEGGRVRTVNGARVSLRRVEGSGRVVGAVIFEGGPAEEPPRAHGASALLASVTAIACEDVAREELGRSLDTLGMSTHPIVVPEGFGIGVDGPPERWREVAFLLTRCVDRPRLAPHWIDRARGECASEPEDRVATADLIAPSAPGRVAPRGRASVIATLSPAELGHQWRLRSGASRARVALVGEVPVEEAAQRLARGIARWPAGTASESTRWDAPTDRLDARNLEGEPFAVVAWTVEGQDAAAARTYAREFAIAIGLEPGLEPQWHDGGANGSAAWAAVALRASPDAVDQLPAHVARALRALPDATVLAERAHRRADDGAAWEGASLRALALRDVLADVPTRSREAAIELVRALARSEPFFVVMRRQPNAASTAD